MIWQSASEFWAMGGYGVYVWGSMGVSAALLVLVGSFDHLLGMGAFLYVGLPLSGIAAQVQLRRQQPDLPRPFLS